MADRKASAGAANFQRRTWDREAATARAAERLDNDEGPARGAITGPRAVSDGVGEAAPYRNAEPGLSGPEGSARAYLTARSVDLRLDAKVNKRKLVTDATPLSSVGGYFCELCQCTLRDSLQWLDHINGVKHQRRMGVSMRVEAATLDDVTAKLVKVKADSTAAASRVTGEADRRDALLEFEGRVSAATEEERKRKKAKRLEKAGGGEGAGDSGVGGAVAIGSVTQANVLSDSATFIIPPSSAAGGGGDAVTGEGDIDFATLMGFSTFK